MNRPAAVRKVYAEFREVCAEEEFSRSELLLLAAEFEALANDRDQGVAGGATWHRGGDRFEYWATDRVLSHRTRRVVVEEASLTADLFQDEPSAEGFCVEEWMRRNAA